jgi:exonuclease-1
MALPHSWSLTEGHYLANWAQSTNAKSKWTTAQSNQSLSLRPAFHSRRSDALARAYALLAEGQHKQARELFVRAVDVTPKMAYQLIKVSQLTSVDCDNRAQPKRSQALKREGVQYIVAPYEADAQMAFLEQRNLVDGIITEDSDLLVFGCRNVNGLAPKTVDRIYSDRLPQVLFKLDSDGQCVEVQRSRFASCREFNMAGWTDNEFRQRVLS